MTAEDRRSLERLTVAVSTVGDSVHAMDVRLSKIETAVTGNGTIGLGERMTSIEEQLLRHYNGHVGRMDRKTIVATRALEVSIMGLVFAAATLLGKVARWW